jgi:hypothetical protein
MLHHNSIHVFVLVYVDDILVTNNSFSTITHLISKLKGEFEVKYLKALSYFLGIQATRTSHELFLGLFMRLLLTALFIYNKYIYRYIFIIYI